MTYPAKHRAPSRRTPIIAAVAAALVLVAATPAAAATPRVNEGWISLVSRTCGSSSGWQTIAKANGSHSPSWILPLRSVTVHCPGRSSGGATKPPAKPSATGWAKPVSGWCSSAYGPRTFFDSRTGTWRSGFHYGQDIAAPLGTIIRAAAGGTVVQAGWNGGYGYSVTIRHSGTTYTLYGHSSQLLVHQGQTVSKGQRIARVGHSGDADGNHLHFEVWTGYKHRTNPRTFMANRGVKVC